MAGKEKTADSVAAECKRIVAEQAAADYVDVFQHLRQRCESPIEDMLLAALVCELRPPIYEQHWSVADACWPNQSPKQVYGFHGFLQAAVGPYRADFYFEYVNDWDDRVPFHLVVECDGHDFHERTKDQAKRDRSRDRWMTSQGIQVVRFTGSEIWADPLKCAGEVGTHLLHLEAMSE